MRIAVTDNEKKRCIEYLTDKGLNPIANIYIYSEVNDNIIACSGIVFAGLIEPFGADNSIEANKLFNFVQGYIASKIGVCVAMTTKENVKNILTKSDFQLWSENSNIYIKEN